MKKSGIIKLSSFILILVILSGIVTATTLAQTEQPTVPPATPAELQLICEFPIVSSPSGSSFGYFIYLVYSGPNPALFSLKATAPPKWTAMVYREQDIIEVPQIELTPNKQTPDAIRVLLTPPAYEYPTPGDYTFTLQANSDDIQTSLDLTARVTARYGIDFSPTNGKLYSDVTAGKDNHVSLTLSNLGSTPIQDILITNTEKPTGWNISFTPGDIASLDVGASKEIDMLIIPPGKTSAGDYKLTVQATPKDQLPTSATSTSTSSANSLDIRITVLSSTILGWIAIIIFVGFISGVAVLLRRAHIW